MQEKDNIAEWPEGVAVSMIHLSRPTDNWDAVVDFYRNGLGLRQLWRGRAGIDGKSPPLPARSPRLVRSSGF